MQRARAAARWATISLISAAMAAFIVFDVLDLDGSNLNHPTNGSTLTTDAPGSETERLNSRTVDPASPWGAPSTIMYLSIPMHPGFARPQIPPSALRAYRTIAHLHTRTGQILRDTASSPSEPA